MHVCVYVYDCGGGVADEFFWWLFLPIVLSLPLSPASRLKLVNVSFHFVVVAFVHVHILLAFSCSVQLVTLTHTQAYSCTGKKYFSCVVADMLT